MAAGARDPERARTSKVGDALVVRIRAALNGTDSRLVLLGAVLLAMGIGVADWLTRPELSLVVFYLLPLLMVAGRCAPRTAVAFALALSLQGIVIGISAPTALSRSVIVWNTGVRTAFYLLVAGLVISLRRVLEDLAWQAERDPLTHAPNRRAFAEAAERAFNSSRRTSRPVTVLYLDVDYLKPVNDSIGHEAGDRLLCRVADVLGDDLRSIDLFARAGGDEFVILLPDSDGDEARQAVARLRQALAVPFELAPGVLADTGVSASFGGWVGVPGPHTTVDDVLQLADQGMYEAKRRRDGSVPLAGEPSRAQGPDSALPPAP
ncbi:MAG: GGDEF domain-containing protein [Acidimicrobiia bacterium]|nr:GGDEF domain-containing protein [Acidimicrobiia bacterium]